MKRLFIAEKPAMARDIAKHMGGRMTKKVGYVEVDMGGGVVNIVASCIGHLLKQAEPADYVKDLEFPGTFADLPILPDQWKLQIAEKKSAQVTLLRRLLRECDEVVNAGDPGREGQLIIDELLEFCGNRKPVKRILLNSLDSATVKRELANLQDNTRFKPIYQAGLGRQRADWLVGMNLSRAYTILGRRAQYRGVLSVGRVQSPTLALVVRRDRAIETFVPRDYWAVKALVRVDGGEFWARWKKPEPAPEWLDEEGRIVVQAEAERIVRATQGQTGQITRFETKPGKEEPLLPFSLATLQIFASAKWGYSAKEVLDACQYLYSEKKCFSYPRTDARHLVVALQAQIPDTLSAIAQTLSMLSPACAKADSSILGKAWDDSKVGEHYALIPTSEAADFASLTPIQQNLYRAVAQRYITLFYPDCLIERTSVEATVAQEVFAASGRVVKSEGWREVYAGEAPEPETPDANGKVAEEKEDEQRFPQMSLGQSAKAAQTVSEQKRTKPPTRMSDSSLLLAMTNVHQLVKDPQLRQRLQSSKGIGTSATRAAIIENLVEKGLLLREGKTLISSSAARVLIDALPATLLDPALSAMWENALDLVAAGKAPLDLFMQKQEAWLRQLLEKAQATGLGALSDAPLANANAGGASRGSGSGSRAGSSSGGSRSAGTSRSSSGSTASSRSAPQTGAGQNAGSGSRTPAPREIGHESSKTAPSAAVKACPECKTGKMVVRQARSGPSAGKPFLGCTNYPRCKHAERMPEKEPAR
ncbi:DNA topoisomerase 3 [Burkholderia vietnamiensis]|uniref:DNA topoisomerase n=1 Tax=Burkholderia vietnamiensis (strain G4 / LMG 22486) TaxID=269482 RepID=A4JFS2_BURVG|nr:DNA topoisomerase III [Burkholderia vietnamiensis G4]MCB4344881.1 DNA topoisomerase 3 [Burkholderia vietnamiensis]